MNIIMLKYYHVYLTLKIILKDNFKSSMKNYIPVCNYRMLAYLSDKRYINACVTTS